MIGRKALIKRLVEGGAQLYVDPTTWLGELTVSTRNTMYKFTNGVCTQVHRAGQEGRPSDFVGMRLAGWLLDEGSAPRVSPTWRPGASAVLLRPGALQDAVALTSPTVQIRRTDYAQMPAHDPMKSSGIVRRIPPPSRFAAKDSMTRIGVPARQRTVNGDDE
jgi:hypothetical protein